VMIPLAVSHAVISLVATAMTIYATLIIRDEQLDDSVVVMWYSYVVLDVYTLVHSVICLIANKDVNLALRQQHPAMFTVFTLKNKAPEHEPSDMDNHFDYLDKLWAVK
jgi:hypothetical protein